MVRPGLASTPMPPAPPEAPLAAPIEPLLLSVVIEQFSANTPSAPPRDAAAAGDQNRPAVAEDRPGHACGNCLRRWRAGRPGRARLADRRSAASEALASNDARETRTPPGNVAMMETS